MSNTARIQAQRKVAREMGQLLRRAKELGMGDLEEQFVPRKYARLNTWNEAVVRLRRAIEERESDLQAQLAAAQQRIAELEAIINRMALSEVRHAQEGAE